MYLNNLYANKDHYSKSEKYYLKRRYILIVINAASVAMYYSIQKSITKL